MLQTVPGADKLLQQVTRLPKAALENYKLSDFKLRLLKELPGKQLFHVFSPNVGNFALRMYVPPSTIHFKEARTNAVLHSEVGLHSQMLWLLDLRRSMRLPVSEPVRLADGSLVGNVSVEGVPRSRNFILIRWIPGKHLTYAGNAGLSRSEVFSLGTYIARLHRHAEQYTVPEGFVRPRWDWDYLFSTSSPLWRTGEILLHKDAMETLRLTAERIRQELLALGKTRDVFGLIHRDLKVDNLIRYEGTLYAIDFDHCGWGYYLYDLAMPYMQLARFGDRCEEMREVLLEGYQYERPLPEGYQEHLRTFIAMLQVMVLRTALDIPRSALLTQTPPRQPWKDGTFQNHIKALKQFVSG